MSGGFSDCQKTIWLKVPEERKERVKGNRHTEPQRGVSERNRRIAAALGAEMGSLSRSITRRSGQNCKIKIQNSDFAILQAACQKSPKGLF